MKCPSPSRISSSLLSKATVITDETLCFSKDKSWMKNCKQKLLHFQKERNMSLDRNECRSRQSVLHKGNNIRQTQVFHSNQGTIYQERLAYSFPLILVSVFVPLFIIISFFRFSNCPSRKNWTRELVCISLLFLNMNQSWVKSPCLCYKICSVLFWTRATIKGNKRKLCTGERGTWLKTQEATVDKKHETLTMIYKSSQATREGSKKISKESVALVNDSFPRKFGVSYKRKEEGDACIPLSLSRQSLSLPPIENSLLPAGSFVSSLEKK